MRNEIVKKNLILTAVTLIIFFFISLYLTSYFNKKSMEKQLINVTMIVKNQIEQTTSEQELKDVINLYSLQQDWLEISVMNSLGVVILNSAQDVEGVELKEDLSKFKNIADEYVVYQKGNNLFMIVNVNDDIFIKTFLLLSSQINYILNHVFFFLFLLAVTFMFSYIYNTNIANNVIDVFTDIKTQLKMINEHSFNNNVIESKYEEVNESLFEINETALNIVNLIKTNKQEREKLDYVINKIQQGIFAVNNEETIVIINEYALKVLGLNAGDNLNDLKNYCGKTLIKRIGYALTKKKDTIFEVHNPLNDLIYAFHSYYIDSKWDIHDKEEGIVITVILDVTQERKSNELKNEFITNAAHELKTPLTSIIGYSELLNHHLIKDEKQKNSYFKKIYEESISMKLTVENLLFLINLETIETINLDEVVSTKNLVKNAIQKYEANIKKKKLNLITTNDEYYILGNELLLSYLVNNLLENAINYNVIGGSVKIDVKEDNSFLYLNMVDSGKGIEKKNLNKIFDKFYRITEGRVKMPGSTGVGLSIVARIVDIHGGTIKVESELNKGTQFEIKFNKYKGENNES